VIKVFLDTIVLVDLIADRKPFSLHAIEIFKKSEDVLIELYTSAHSIVTTHYILKKYLGEKELRDVLLNLLDFLNIVPVDIEMLQKGLRSEHKDFEDAVQVLCSASIKGMDFIVTRNSKDFRKSDIPVVSPDELSLRL